MSLTLQEVKDYGFSFPAETRGFMSDSHYETARRIAQDAALVSTPNTQVPVELTAYIDPMVIEIMTAPRNARQIFGEVKKGDWTAPYFKFASKEYTGASQPYTDYADGITSGVNLNWMNREQYRYQTSIIYGDLETQVTSQARVDLVSEKQRAAAAILDTDANKFALLGVAGHAVYGILNDPNLPSATAVTSWATKTADQIYADIVGVLFNGLTVNSAGIINQASPLVLAVSPAMQVKLGTAKVYGDSNVLDMLHHYFSNLRVVVLPELATASSASGEIIFLICTEVNGQPTAELAFGMKLQAGRVVPELTSYRQKYMASTYGGVVYYPFAFAAITGMDAEPESDSD